MLDDDGVYKCFVTGATYLSFLGLATTEDPEHYRSVLESDLEDSFRSRNAKASEAEVLAACCTALTAEGTLLGLGGAIRFALAVGSKTSPMTCTGEKT